MWPVLCYVLGKPGVGAAVRRPTMMFAAAHLRRTSNSFLKCCRIQHLRNAAFTSRYTSSSATSAWKGVGSAIQDAVDGGKLLFDPLQQQAAKKLTRVQRSLETYNHDSFRQQLQRIEDHHKQQQLQQKIEQKQQDDTIQKIKEFNKNEEQTPSISIQVPRGFYIHGPVGTGKSMMLNVFYEHAPTHKKRRLHFHSFLQEIHQRIHILNKQLLDEHGRSFHIDTAKSRNPILRIAQQVSEEVTLLCIDEFQVTDIADAMILAQFFGELWRQGVIVAATSNRPPDALYEGGLNREYFLPFIDLLKKYCVVHHLADRNNVGDVNKTGIDYRRVRSGVNVNESNKHGDYFHLTTNGASQELDRLFLHYQEKHPITTNAQPITLQVNFKRTMSVHRAHSDIIARFTFDELCTTELGSSDYNAIANHFQIVMVENIPHLNLKYPDRARRFITLIDELYEAECCLVCSAADVPDRLFIGKSTEEESGTDANKSEADNNVSPNGTMLAVDVAQSQGTALSGLASVRELSFAFRRAASRVLEMSSKSWWEEKL
jgi:protein AFG1